MPLIKSASPSARSSNIKELMESWKQGGNFAKGKPKWKAHQMAIAAAFNIKKRR